MTTRSSPHSKLPILRLLLLAALVMVIVCAIAGFIWWQRYKSSPAYSVALLVDAARRNDTAAFDELLDTDQVVENFVADAVGKTARDYTSVLPTSLRNQFAEIAKGTKEKIKPVIREGVREEITELSGQAAGKPFIMIVLAIRLKTKVIEDGDQARATLKAKDEQLELLLQRRDGGWRVISFKDDALAARIIAQIAKDLPGKLSTDGLPKLPAGVLPSGIPFVPQR